MNPNCDSAAPGRALSFLNESCWFGAEHTQLQRRPVRSSHRDWTTPLSPAPQSRLGLSLQPLQLTRLFLQAYNNDRLAICR